MARRQPYTLIFARGVANHLKTIDAKYHGLVRDKLDEQLLFQPTIETRNRKPLRQPGPFGAAWEVRFGPDNRLPVLYDIDEAERVVQILAIGEKEGNRLFVGGVEIEL